MCGIAGFWEFEGNADLRCVLERMTDSLIHRGPDGHGQWIDDQKGVALGHRRLAIVGGGVSGHQPMRTLDGRFTFIVNGELYNFHELQRELNVVSDSDSEVMLAGLAAWGMERALERFNGMFAFALWDAVEETLHLVRDRVGEKPLYYGWWDGSFVFGSEIKALRAHPGFRSELDTDALASYMRYSYVGGEKSIYKSIRKLPPGMRLVVKGRAPVDPVPYWLMSEMVLNAGGDAFAGDAYEAVEVLESLLGESVRLRLRSDVPMGVFLSGGLDSASILALMAQRSGAPVKSFSIGMPDTHLDESPMARSIAEQLGSDHSALLLDESMALRLVSRLSDVYDEPFADASAIPSLCVAALAGCSVKTVMGGDGGDEILGGYSRYATAAKLHRQTHWLPGPLRRLVGKTIQASCSGRLLHIGQVLADGYPRSIHWHLVSHWKAPGPLLSTPAHFLDEIRRPFDGPSGVDFGLDLLQMDLLTLLPGDLLVKVDRASMAHAVEVRLPFLDPAVMAFCLRLPEALRNRDGESKWVLRQLLRKYLPESMIALKKKGFSVPLAAWLRGPLRDWAEDLLSELSLRRSALLSVEVVRGCWREHLAGRADFSRALWNVLMLQAFVQQGKA